MKKRRKKLSILLFVPPVLLAALFIWLLAGQLSSMKAAAKFAGRLEDRTAEGMSGGNLQDYDSAGGGEGRIDGGDGNGNIQGSEPGKGADSGADDTITLLFGGDIYLSSHVLNAYDKSRGIEGVLDDSLRTAISESDIFMANEEFPFSDRGAPVAGKEYNFCLPTKRVAVMKEIGPDLVALANNHTLDYGPDALLDTCDTLDAAGIRHVGAGRNLDAAKSPCILERKGKRIGFLAASRVIPTSDWSALKNRPGLLTTYDPAILLTEIQTAKTQCDYLVVYVHWGIEKQTAPEEYQRTLARQYIDSGADLVVGSHPHVLQGIEYYNGKPIVYSLGNFVFGSSIPNTALLKVELTKGTTESRLTLIPAVSSAGFTRRMEESSRPNFFQSMEDLSFGISIDNEGRVSH